MNRKSPVLSSSKSPCFRCSKSYYRRHMRRPPPVRVHLDAAHDAFAKALSELGIPSVAYSPTKPSRRLLLDQQQPRQQPLSSLIGQLENVLLNASPYAMRKRSTPRAGSCISPIRMCKSPIRKTQLPPPPPPKPAATPAAAAPSRGLNTQQKSTLPSHVRKQVLKLFETWSSPAGAAEQQPSSLRRPQSSSLDRSTSLGHLPPASAAAAAARPSTPGTFLPSLAKQRSTPALRRPTTGKRVHAGATGTSSGPAMHASTVHATKATSLSFEGVLRLYFKRATAPEMAAMLALVAPQMQSLDRRKWIAGVKAEHTEKIRMAFLMGDSDGDGMLSLSEFADAVALHRGHGPSGRRAGGGAAASADFISAEELAAVFLSSDKDGNGQLDLDEFVELVASHPKLMLSFEDILTHGVQRRLKAEQAKLDCLFRYPVSPTSRGVASPSGLRRRPTLADLKPTLEVVLPKEWELA